MLLLDIKCHENDAIYIFQHFDKIFKKWKFHKILNKNCESIMLWNTYETFRCKLMLDVEHLLKNIETFSNACI